MWTDFCVRLAVPHASRERADDAVWILRARSQEPKPEARIFVGRWPGGVQASGPTSFFQFFLRTYSTRTQACRKTRAWRRYQHRNATQSPETGTHTRARAEARMPRARCGRAYVTVNTQHFDRSGGPRRASALRVGVGVCVGGWAAGAALFVSCPCWRDLSNFPDPEAPSSSCCS